MHATHCASGNLGTKCATVPPTTRAGMNEPLSDEVLDDLVQIVTHRIASLTAGVEGYADLLADSLHTPDQRRLVRHILEGVARINGVVDDLRFFTRPIAPVSAPLRLSALIASVLDILTDDERDQITLADPESDDIRIHGDPHLCRQALHALLRNALDAAGPTGTVEITARRREAFVEVRIWNDGPTLSAEDTRRALAPFYTTKAQNLGLGLTIAYRMARAQGGDVEFEPRPEGTTVCLRLPVAVAQ